MQIYCDESGGFDKDKHSLLVAAVNTSSGDAARLMKQFRKTTRIKGEIKGGLLSPKERALFFEMLADAENVSAVISCNHSSLIGGWATKMVSEHAAYTSMMIEACSQIPPAGAMQINVISDGGRYSKAILHQIALSAGASLTDTYKTKTVVEFGSSERDPGIQIADIIANTVYRVTPYGQYDLTEHEVCGVMTLAGRLTVRHANLDELRPKWISAAE